MTIDIYEIDQKLYDDQSITRKWFKNNQCVLGYKNPKTVMINDIPFLNTVGFHIIPGESIEIKNSGGESTKITLKGNFDKVKIEKDGISIKVTTLE